jgi:hypothetical protein
MMRTWTLAFDGHYTNAALDGDYNQPNGITRDPTWVIELEPMLDLLKAWIENDGLGAMDHEQASARLLREHGGCNETTAKERING